MADWRTAAGDPVPLGPRIAAGGEGTVHALPGEPGLCAKIYHPAVRSTERRTKLEAMLARPPADPTAAAGHRSIAWPERLLFEGGDLAGFIMPLLPEGAAIALRYLQPEDRLRHRPGFTYEYLLTAGRNLAAAVAAVHRTGCCVGDINESNCLITGRALVTLIDCDSFQVPLPSAGLSHCPVGKPEYTAPELVGTDLRTAVRTPSSDAFGLAVLVFQLLMQGFHPFAGRWSGPGEPPSVAERIRRGLYAYDGRPGYPPPPAAPPARILSPALREAFRRAFAPGAAELARRPGAGDWVRLLDAARAHLRDCPRNPHHRFGTHLRACPWCAAAEAGRDYFPAPVGAQVSLPETSARTAPPAPTPPTRVAAPGAARLQATPPRLDFTGLVRGGAPQTAWLTLRNIGKDVFRGRLVTRPPADHLAFSPAEITLSPFHGENELRVAVRARAGSMPWGGHRVAAVTAVGNAPPVSVQVSAATVQDAAAVRAADTFARIGVWAAPAVAGAAAWAAGARGWPPAADALLWVRAWLLAPSAPLWWPAVAVWGAGAVALLPAFRPRVGAERPKRNAPRIAALLAALGDGVACVLAAGAYARRPGTGLLLAGGLAAAFVPLALAVALGLRRAGRGPIRGFVSRRGAGFPAALAVAGALGLGAPCLAVAAGAAAHALAPPAVGAPVSAGPPGLPPGALTFTLEGGPAWRIGLAAPGTGSVVAAGVLGPRGAYAPGGGPLRLAVPGGGAAHVALGPTGLAGTLPEAGWRYLVVDIPAGAVVALTVDGRPLHGGRPIRGPAVVAFRRV